MSFPPVWITAIALHIDQEFSAFLPDKKEDGEQEGWAQKEEVKWSV